jgi:hypothetical protein
MPRLEDDHVNIGRNAHRVVVHVVRGEQLLIRQPEETAVG